jgi:hypothetical protein
LNGEIHTYVHRTLGTAYFAYNVRVK